MKKELLGFVGIPMVGANHPASQARARIRERMNTALVTAMKSGYWIQQEFTKVITMHSFNQLEFIGKHT